MTSTSRGMRPNMAIELPSSDAPLLTPINVSAKACHQSSTSASKASEYTP